MVIIFFMKQILFSAALLLTAAKGYSQDTLSTLDEVVVTANKFSSKTSQTGKVITVITKQQILESGSKDLAQILNEYSGLNINGAISNPGKDKSVYLRGAKVDHTLILIDGVPVYDASGIGSNFDIRLLSTSNIERIEILKGSQSALYGSDAVAGVIHIITQKETTQKNKLNGLVSYGSYGSLQANADYSGKYKKFDYHVGYSYFQTKGISEASDTSGAAEVERDPFSRQQIAIDGKYQINSRINIRPYLRYSTFQQDYDQGAFTQELDLTSSNQNIQTGFSNQIKAGKLDIQTKYNYNNILRTYTDDSTKSRNGYDIFSEGTYRAKEHFAETFGVYTVNDQLKLTLGMDFRTSRTAQDYLSISAFGPYESSLGSDSLRQQQTGVYAAGVYNSKTGFNFEAALRYNHHDAYGGSWVYNFNPSFPIGKNTKLFMNVSSAYRTPSLYQLYSEYGNKNLKPEIGTTFESGVQYVSQNKKLETGVVFYSRSVKDMISFYYNPTTWESFYINQDEQNDFGLELQTRWRIGKSTSIGFFYNYIDGNITTVQNNKDTSYYNLIRRPKHSFSVNLAQQIGEKMKIRLGMFYYDSRKDLGFDAVNYTTIEVRLKPYFISNLYAEYSMFNNKIVGFADIRNLTNTKFTEVYGFNTMGLNGYAGFRWNW